MRSCPPSGKPPSLKSFVQSTLESTPFGLNEAVRRDGFSLFNFSQRARDSFSPLHGDDAGAAARQI
jgi:hypothetical protein